MGSSLSKHLKNRSALVKCQCRSSPPLPRMLQLVGFRSARLLSFTEAGVVVVTGYKQLRDVETLPQNSLFSLHVFFLNDVFYLFLAA